jgi:hypothetical protein
MEVSSPSQNNIYSGRAGAGETLKRDRDRDKEREE